MHLTEGDYSGTAVRLVHVLCTVAFLWMSVRKLIEHLVMSVIGPGILFIEYEFSILIILRDYTKRQLLFTIIRYISLLLSACLSFCQKSSYSQSSIADAKLRIRGRNLLSSIALFLAVAESVAVNRCGVTDVDISCSGWGVRVPFAMCATGHTTGTEIIATRISRSRSKTTSQAFTRRSPRVKPRPWVVPSPRIKLIMTSTNETTLFLRILYCSSFE